MASAASFASGAAVPTVLVALLPHAALTLGVVGATLVVLLVLGATAVRLGGASLTRGALRVAFWGAVAMGFTALVGRLTERGIVVVERSGRSPEPIWPDEWRRTDERHYGDTVVWYAGPRTTVAA